MRLGGVPTGVPMPPIEDENDVISIIAIANRANALSCLRPRPISASTASPRGNIIAVVAVLLIHMEITQVTDEYTTTRRKPLRPIHGDASAVNAMRRSRRCTNIASARMKLPMNRKMIGSAKGAKTVAAGATPSNTASVGPTSAVTGSGSASVIQSTIISDSVAARRCAGTGMADGAASTARNTSGPAMRPVTARTRLN